MRMTTQTHIVLGALMERGSAGCYGLEISRATKLRSGTLYPILARLDHAGWVHSEWEAVDPHDVGRRPRRYYRLTGAGERAARQELEGTAERIGRALGASSLIEQGRPA